MLPNVLPLPETEAVVRVHKDTLQTVIRHKASSEVFRGEAFGLPRPPRNTTLQESLVKTK